VNNSCNYKYAKDLKQIKDHILYIYIYIYLIQIQDNIGLKPLKGVKILASHSGDCDYNPISYHPGVQSKSSHQNIQAQEKS
jgi:hypothetical protein